MLATFSLQAQNREAAFQMNQRLGRGINMGNAFEAPSENAWGNPWQPEYFEIISDIEFDHVRLPIRWEPDDRSMADSPYTISDTFLQRIKKAVDKALEENLIIIINMHHHEALYADPEGEKERFLAQWNQIAEFFKDYPEELLFEVLNEPHGEISPQNWNTLFAEALSEIRITNPNRFVLMGTAEYGGLAAVPYINLPDDDNIILTVHYYNPFQFTHQGAEWVGEHADEWLGTQWYDTETDRETVRNEFETVLNFSKNQNIPLHVGEFGAYSTADMGSRARWTTFLARWFEEQGLSWAYWEFSAGFGIYDPNTGELCTPLVDALLNNKMPEPVPVTFSSVYEADFSSGTDGWTFYTQNNALGSLINVNNAMTVDVSNQGSESWHAQAVKSGIELVQGQMYELTIEGTSDTETSIPVYIGKASSPWDNYSGTFQLGLNSQTSESSFSFTMSGSTDSNCRIVFDLGLSTGHYEISTVLLKKVIIDSAIDSPASVGIKFFPNPVQNQLFYSSSVALDRIAVVNLQGQKILEFDANALSGNVNITSVPAGVYFIIASFANRQRVFQKIIIN